MIRVLWLTPKKPANISVGRQRIASHLESNGFEIEMRAGRPTVLYESLSSQRHDIIIGTTRAGAIFGCALSILTGSPLVVDHVDPIQQLAETDWWPIAKVVERMENLAFRRSEHTLYVYSEEKERISQRAPAFSQTNLGVEYERFAHPDSSIVEVAQSQLAEKQLEENVAIYIGGLEPIYHIRKLVESVSYLNNWSLVILGSGSLEDFVITAAENEPKIVYLGTVPHDHVPGYLQVADVGVSLVNDPHTLKVLEYGAARLPTVQLSGQARQKFEGMVEFCENDTKSIAHAIQRAVASDIKRIDEFQALAAEYSWEQIASDYAKVLRESLAE
ncbi:glycosyltransferase [Haloarcula nitratireducens]|uniref:Glycosyltransferase n=1 Tax=Haloarcula nitratireducens TaxID=2487749 RepID=A0AAW4P8U5_9EURY|nr:glycosyltransferase [Halomicroarcula nitratireducens]MBX0294013.1 glycosyltransferase [Halomicroarcula nitratireducens]